MEGGEACKEKWRIAWAIAVLEEVRMKWLFLLFRDDECDQHAGLAIVPLVTMGFEPYVEDDSRPQTASSVRDQSRQL